MVFEECFSAEQKDAFSFITTVSVVSHPMDPKHTAVLGQKSVGASRCTKKLSLFIDLDDVVPVKQCRVEGTR